MSKYDASDVAHNHPRGVRYELAEHEVMLSFNNDCGAELFYEWWRNGGRAAFEAWACEQEIA